MYLSQLILNPRHRAVQRDLSRPHDLHQTIMAAFPDNLDKAKERVLFRMEQRAQPQQLILLIQSQEQPDWSKLPASYLLDDPATKAVNLQLQPGQRLSFRLRANPTKRLSAGKGNNGKRIGLYKLEEQINWLQRKATDHGFAIHSAMPTQQQRVDDRRQDLKFFSVQFDGILQVTDPTTFLAAIQSGIGSGKAFGFGLLSVAPAG
ncbi:MAG: type I-E CRISPR-associated protein Cas6/Cse3/CasE [Caldilineaceae bacterium]|nr:type I-E CRISPR-associated protein Cas6/Cse3/CasE [Caldilineaceae bacterium]